MNMIKIKKNEDGKVFCRINSKTKRGQYFILKDTGQYKYCEKIELEGFENLPSGFWTNNGYGLTNAGTFILQEIHDKYGKKIALKIVAPGKQN